MALRIAARQARLVVFGYNAVTSMIKWLRNPDGPQYAGYPLSLSGGVKTLILVFFEPAKIFNASTCGDNCAEWLLKIADERKVVVNLRHLMDFGKGEFKIKILNTGKIVKNMGDLVAEAGEFV